MVSPKIIYKEGLTLKEIRLHLKEGRHLNNRPITDEAMTALLSVRKQFNLNLRTKRNVKDREKI